MNERPCCRVCKGSAPHMFCRWKACDCHKVTGSAPSGRPLYKDLTAEKAIGRADSDRSGTGYQGRPIYTKAR